MTSTTGAEAAGGVGSRSVTMAGITMAGMIASPFAAGRALVAVVWGGLLTSAVMAAPPATIVKQADSLIDARGMTLALNATYGIMINGGVSANDVIVSANGYQYTAYYVKDTTSGTSYYVAAARRRAPTAATPGGSWEVANLTTSAFVNGLSGGVPWNSHCAIALGIDLNNNKLHLAWDMHNKTLRYRASPANVTTGTPGAWSAAVFGTETSKMGGQTLSGVTYPNFVRDANGSLGFFYRYGTSSTGYWQTRDYDGTTATPSWSSAFVYDSGTGTDPGTGSAARTAYPNGFSVDRTNRYHMTFVWREDVNGGGDGTNHDLCYAYSDDKGLTWRNNAGAVIASQAAGTKISIASPGLVVRPIPQGSGLMNTQGQDVDASGHVHALMYHRDTAKSATTVGTFTPSASSYFHYWRDGLGNWHRNQVPFDCTGARPRLYFDGNDNAVAVLADGSLRVFAATKASNWTDWTLVDTEANFLSDSVADRDLFRSTGVLSVFEQRPPFNNLAASEVRSLDFIPTFVAPATARFAATDGGWAPGNWASGTAPGGDSFAIVDAGRRATVDAASGLVSVHSLGLGTAAGSGALVIAGGTLQVVHTIDVGREAGGRGDYRQSGGSVSCDRFVVGEFVSETSGGGASTAVVSGGSLAIRELAIATAAGGTSSGSSFTVTGGSVGISGEVVLGDCGNAATLDVRGGRVSVTGDVGPGANGINTATLCVTGGTFDATGNVIRVDRLVLGSGALENAPAVSAKQLSVAGSVPTGVTIGALVVSAATGDVAAAAALPGATGLAALTVRRGGSVSFTTAVPATLPVASLTIETGPGGGRIDLGAGRLEVAAGGVSEAALRTAILAGRGDGSWNGATGIGTSLGGAWSGVGYVVGGDGSAGVAWAAYGDTNLDGLVDVLDAADILSAARYDRGGGSVWSQGDTNYDGMVDVLDVADMLGTGLYDAGWYAPAAARLVAVPEPGGGSFVVTALAILSGVAGGWWRRRGCRGRLRVAAEPEVALLVVLAVVAAGQRPAVAQSGSYDWSAASTLYGGVDRAFVQITGTAPLKVNCLRIDTLTPGINFLTTPRANPWVSGTAETVRQTTSNFLLTSQTTATKVVAAVNGDLFNIALSPTTTLEGFNVSNGTLVSPGAAPGGQEHSTFSLTRSNAGSIVTTDDSTPVADKWNAVTGIYRCLTGGVPQLSGTDPQPRTGLGVSNDTRYVYMMTVDGRSSSSIGATNRQVGEWLLYFGAANGVYVDGGGSTTMAWWNPAASGTNKAQVLNTPSDGSERAVGNNIGVYFSTPSYAPGEYYWAGNGVRGGGGTWDAASTTWRSGAIYGSATTYASGSSAVGTTAVFTGAGGQVVPAAGTSAEKIRFENAGFQLGTALAQSDITLVGTPEVKLDVGVSATIRSRITATNLVLRGSGTTVDNQLNLWPLSGSNALSGTLQLVDRVRVEFAFAGSAGSAAVAVQNGSTLDLRGYGVTYANPLTLAGAGVSGTGWALRFASGDTVAGGIRLTGSTAIRLGDTGAVAASITSAITGTGGLSLTGVGASSLGLTGRNTYSGTTTVDLGSGGVRIGVAAEGSVGAVTAGAFGTGPVILASGRLSGLDAATPRTILNPVSITGTAFLGDAYLAAPLTFAAAVTLSGSRAIAVDSPTTFAGGVGQSGTGGFMAKSGTGTLVLQGTSSYTGGGTVSAGTLVFAVTAARPTTGRTAVAAGATLALGVGGTSGSWVASNVDQLFFSGTGAGTLARVDMDPLANVGIDTSAGDFTYASSPGSQRGLVKLGPNTLTMAGSGTFTGGTRILEGRLVMAGATALSSGSVAVASGATLGVAPQRAATIGSLGLASSGLVDLTTGQLTVTTGMTAAGLVARIVEGRGDGTWTGTSGITSSAAAAAIVAGQSRAVGWLDAGSGGFTVGYAAPGDTNLDDLVDVLDAANFVAPGLFDTVQPATWNQGDFNYDGMVDILDAADLTSTGLFDAGFYERAAAVAAVPEPVTPLVGVAAIMLSGLTARPRRRCRRPSP